MTQSPTKEELAAGGIGKTVGNNIRRLRYEHKGKMTQGMLAFGIGTTANTVSRWETAFYHPSIVDLDKMARFFNVPIAEFFLRSPGPERLCDSPSFIPKIGGRGRTEYCALRPLHKGRHYYDSARKSGPASPK